MAKSYRDHLAGVWHPKECSIDGCAGTLVLSPDAGGSNGNSGGYDWVRAYDDEQSRKYEEHKHDTDTYGNPTPRSKSSSGETVCP